MSRIYFFYRSTKNESQWIEKYQNVPIKDHYKVVILMSPLTNPGLRSLAKRINVAAKALGWESYLIEDLSHNISQVKRINPDFVISVLYDHNIAPEVFSWNVYAYFVQSAKSYFGGNLKFRPQFKDKKIKNIDKITGFLCTFKVIDFIKEYVEHSGRTFYGFQTINSAQKTNFEEIEYKNIVYFSTNWDKPRSSNRFKILFKKLAREGYFNVYGPEEAWSYVNEAWKGFTDGDGWDVINLTKNYGISLIIHSKANNRDGIATARIFEAAAASSIIICDKNDFVVKNFKDTVLYINAESSANVMFDEIVSQLNWIKQNPEQAREKARRAHEVFVKNFTLEQELIKVAKMHEYIKVHKK